MRIFLLPCIMILISFSTYSQTSIMGAFNSTMSGRSITFTASHIFKQRHEVGGGLRLNINSLAHPDDQQHAYYKRLFATKPIHFFGLQAFYRFHFLNKWKHVKPFAFYDVQYAYSTTYNRMYLPFMEYQGETLYQLHKQNFGPYSWLEQNIGLGFRVKLPANLFIYQMAGVGITTLFGPNQLGKPIPPGAYQFSMMDGFAYEFGYMLHIGLGYTFKDKKDKKM